MWSYFIPPFQISRFLVTRHFLMETIILAQIVRGKNSVDGFSLLFTCLFCLGLTGF